MTPQIPPPEVVSLQVCERILRDRLTDQVSVIGINRIISAEGFPIVIPHVYVFMEFSGGRGRVPLEVRIVDADEARRPVFVAPFEAEFPDPLTVVQVPIIGVSVRFPAPGEYRVQVFCGGALLRQRGLSLRQQAIQGLIRPGGESPPHPPRQG